MCGSLLHGLTPESRSSDGKSNLWTNCKYNGPGDQCGNCGAFSSAPNEAQGTLRNYHHILAQNVDYFADITSDTFPNDPSPSSSSRNDSDYASLPMRLAAVLGRSAHATASRTRLSHGDDRDFIEADVVATISYAAGVKFLLADMPSLFGSPLGVELQYWAAQLGWGLVWSLGWEEGDWGRTFPGGVGTSKEDGRLLDLTALAAVRNASTNGGGAGSNLTALDVQATRTYALKWDAIAAARREPAGALGLNWTDFWSAFTDDLPAAAFVVPLSAASCADIDRCIGVTRDGDCMCYPTE